VRELKKQGRGAKTEKEAVGNGRARNNGGSVRRSAGKTSRRTGVSGRFAGCVCGISFLLVSVALFLGLSVLRLNSRGLETKLASIDGKIKALVAERKEYEAGLAFFESPRRIWGDGEKLGMKPVSDAEIRIVFVD